MISDAAIDRIATREVAAFRKANPNSLELGCQAAANWFQGVPFHWMLDWPSPVPLVAEKAEGATLTTVDGRVLDDFCLGDTASMFGHSPKPLADALAKQAREGLSYMLPTEKGVELGGMLAAMFCLPRWQVTTTASEANRAVIRWCRGITGRQKILIFNGCYHGAVDDVFVDLRAHASGWEPQVRASLIGQVQDLLPTTTVIEFNDVEALERELKRGDIACVLAEPVMTNVGMVRDAPGYLDTLRRLCSETGTVLVFDETHTISSGYGGHSKAFGPQPDMMVIGKSIGGGVPTAVYGFSDEIAERMAKLNASRPSGHSGIGTTLSANALAITAMHAMLGKVITHEAYAHMLTLARRLVKGIESVIAAHQLPWHVVNVGARVEFVCAEKPSTNGSEARAAMNHRLEAALHLYLANRGILLAPFHNMMLLSPVTGEVQVDRLVAELGNAVGELCDN
ncbi:aspartate aminotransferase family protein [Sphingorhabdus sp.]|uniref:aspartate aminotransferase family protein n=1 Tax=Sphingorhabdus sp. TaxID=1902408 RepID=UPI003BAE39F4|nr:aspartate aminotransferase family protein [Sphingomonadales bacterium]MBK9433399.1 aspartate aminotransferase family protein [Sphingomonadales bacterium]MBL0020959.1 aspartate aminotransferase family protein [Sphingomonadales bacterium]